MSTFLRVSQSGVSLYENYVMAQDWILQELGFTHKTQFNGDTGKTIVSNQRVLFLPVPLTLYAPRTTFFTFSLIWIPLAWTMNTYSFTVDRGEREGGETRTRLSFGYFWKRGKSHISNKWTEKGKGNSSKQQLLMHNDT